MIATPVESALQESVGGVRIVGRSEAIQRVRRAIRGFADSPLPILLIGATGTGKEVCARAIHGESRRRGLFVPADCAALPASLVESELFGHRRGAFTGADRDSPGLVAHADGGSLFLDEVCSLPLDGQAKLLRTIESGQVRALGRASMREVDVRVIAAVQPGGVSHGLGALRDDLRFRLGSVVIRLPTLAERRGDVRPIAEFFASLAGAGLEPLAARLLEEREWPGNVRELKSAVERAIALADGAVVAAIHVATALEFGFEEPRPSAPIEAEPLAGARSRILELLEECAGDANAVGRRLGVTRSTVYRRCRALGISVRSIARAGWADTPRRPGVGPFAQMGADALGATPDGHS